MKFFKSNKGHNTVKNYKKITCNSHNPDLIYVSMHIQNFIQIHPLVLKILRKNEQFTSIKGHNSVVNERNWPICNPKRFTPNVNAHAKFEENPSQNTDVRDQKRSGDGQTDGYSNSITQYPFTFCVAGCKKQPKVKAYQNKSFVTDCYLGKAETPGMFSKTYVKTDYFRMLTSKNKTYL